MNAIKTNIINVPRPRIKLSEAVPLDKPLMIRMDTTNLCNLKCIFCAATMNPVKNHYTLGYDLFCKYIDKIFEHYGTIKNLSLGVSGEPLVNPKTTDMISYASKKEAFESIEMITNGVLINNEVADKLIASGITLLRISVNGLSNDDYEKNCGCNLDFDSFVSNLTYLFEHRGKLKIYIKIIDYMVDTEEKCKKFYNIFEPISDWCGVQCLVENKSNMKSEKISNDVSEFVRSITGIQFDKQVEVCPQPFFTLIIAADGDVQPCCTNAGRNVKSTSLGNMDTSTIKEIHLKSLNLQKQLLLGRDKISGACHSCDRVNQRVSSLDDYLDDQIEEILVRYSNLQ